MVEPGIETGTSWLVDRNSDHQATSYHIKYKIRYTSQTQQIYYGVQGQVTDNMFRPFYSSAAIIRSNIPLRFTLFELMMAALE